MEVKPRIVYFSSRQGARFLRSLEFPYKAMRMARKAQQPRIRRKRHILGQEFLILNQLEPVGAIAEGVAYDMRQAGYSSVTAQVAGGAVGGATANGVIYLFLGGPANAAGAAHLAAAGRVAMRGGIAGAAGSLVQSGLEELLKAGNNCGCQ